MKTSQKHSASIGLANITGLKHFNVTLIRPNDFNDVSMEVISAPELSVAFMSARHIFPGARILSIVAVTAPVTLGVQHKTSSQTKHAPPQSPGARFIRGMFRPALFSDESELTKLGE